MPTWTPIAPAISKWAEDNGILDENGVPITDEAGVAILADVPATPSPWTKQTPGASPWV